MTNYCVDHCHAYQVEPVKDQEQEDRLASLRAGTRLELAKIRVKSPYRQQEQVMNDVPHRQPPGAEQKSANGFQPVLSKAKRAIMLVAAGPNSVAQVKPTD
jgi:hypothetical protein